MTHSSVDSAQQFSFPKSKIRTVLFEGVHPNGVGILEEGRVSGGVFVGGGFVRGVVGGDGRGFVGGGAIEDSGDGFLSGKSAASFGNRGVLCGDGSD